MQLLVKQGGNWGNKIYIMIFDANDSGDSDDEDDDISGQSFLALKTHHISS